MLSVVICTYNPKKVYLERVIEALRQQTLRRDHWELLVVDNASTTPISDLFDLKWHPAGRHVREEKLGLAYARVRGMREAQKEIVVFVDDDNVLAQNYLEEVVRIGKQWPQLGVWGGSSLPEFEITPPESLREYLQVLALREVKISLWSNSLNCEDAEPWGAGLCVRRSVCTEYQKYRNNTDFLINGRTGKQLLSCEDTEICMVSCGIGLGMGIFPELTLVHLISKERLTEQYLLRIHQGTTTSRILLNYKWNRREPPTIWSPKNILGLIKNMVILRGFRRRLFFCHRNALRDARDIVAMTRKRKLYRS